MDRTEEGSYQIDQKAIQQARKLISLLSAPLRQRMMETIEQNPGITQIQLRKIFRIDQSRTSLEIRYLVNWGYIERQPAGGYKVTWKYYQINNQLKTFATY